MSQISEWFEDNDMAVTLRSLKSSTMNSTSFLNSSTGVTLSLWTQNTTGSTSNRINIGGSASVNVAYSTGTTSGANGTYRVVVGTSATTGLSTGLHLTGIVTVAHSGTDGKFRQQYRVTRRGTT